MCWPLIELHAINQQIRHSNTLIMDLSEKSRVSLSDFSYTMPTILWKHEVTSSYTGLRSGTILPFLSNIYDLNDSFKIRKMEWGY